MRILLFSMATSFLLLLSGCVSMQKGIKEVPSYAPAVIVGKDADTQVRSAPFEVHYADMVNDFLVLQMSYSGGCEEHTFEVLSKGNYTSTYPPEITVFIKHHDNGDKCRGIIDEKRYFDAKPLRYPGTNRVRIVFAHNNKILDYTY